MGRRVPKLCRHKSTHRAYVNDPYLGKEVYLGPFGSPEADTAYDNWVKEFLLRRAAGGVVLVPGSRITVADLVEAFLAHASAYYRKDGVATSEYGLLEDVLADVTALYGSCSVSAFGPVELKVVRQKLVERKLARTHVNKQIQRVRRAWRWGVEAGLVEPSLLAGLAAVAGLRIGRSAAPETEPVKPVPLATVLSTVKHLAPTVRAMVLVQLYTGMRPGEVRILRPCDLDRSTCPWVYLPPKHKGQHLGRSRKVLIGPQARAILAPILARRDPGTWVFGTAGTKGGGKRTGYYRRDAYTRAVARACQRAGVEHWSPLQLRHTAATLFRSKDGLEASQVLLGHARADVTQIYAEPREELARQVIERLG